jgi:O-antigen/teichoic acid export membrane protein
MSDSASVGARPDAPDRFLARLFEPGTLRARFASGVLWSLSGAVLSRLTAIAAVVVAGRMLGATGFGEFGMLQSTIELLSVIAGLGLALTATRFIAAHRSDADRAGAYLGLSVAASAAAATLCGLLLLPTAPFFANALFSAPRLAHELRLGVPLLIFSAITATQVGCLAGLEAFRAVAIAGALRGLLGAAGLVAGLFLGGLAGGLLGLGIAEALCAAVIHFLLASSARTAGLRVRMIAPLPLATDLLRFSVPALLATMATLPAMWLARVALVNQPGGYAQLGLFTAALKWNALLMFVPSAAAAIVLPMLSSLHGTGDARGYRRLFMANLAVSATLALIPAVVIALMAETIMSAFGTEYRAGAWVLVLMALGAVPMVINTALGQTLVSAGRIWWRFAFDALLALLLLGTALLLIPRMLAAGMAIAYVVAFTTAAVGLAVFVRMGGIRPGGVKP